MKQLIVLWLAIIGFSVIAAAQSGRRPAPTPVPTPIPKTDSEQDRQYSDSTSNKTHQENSVPSLRGDGGSSKPEMKPPTASTDDAKIETETNSEGVEVLKIDNSLITIPVSIFDRNGLYIPNLDKSNFKIFEDGKEQEIAYFAASEQPFTVVLLLDVSPSTEYKINEIQDAAIAFVNQLKAQDSVIIIEFDQSVRVLTDVTNDRQKIAKAIRRTGFGSGTSLYDAVDYTLRKKMSKIQGRKAVVLFTDGVDTTSYKNNYDSSLRGAEESDTPVFPVYYNTFFNNSGGVMSSPYPPVGRFPGGVTRGSRGTSSGEYLVGKKYLEDLAANTGGTMFKTEASSGGLTGAFAGIAEELRRQYSIGYYPTDIGQAGQRKQIKVRLNRPNVVVRARDSYIVGATDKTQTTTSKFNFGR